MSSPKPPTPPPAYSELDPSHSSSPAPNPNAHAHAHGRTPPLRMDTQAAFTSPVPFSPHSGYGPTSIIQQQSELLPYYDPRSPYAVAEASSRARWRFVTAFCWAILILAVASAVLGIEIDIQNNPWNGDYLRRMVFGNADAWSTS